MPRTSLPDRIPIESPSELLVVARAISGPHQGRILVESVVFRGRSRRLLRTIGAQFPGRAYLLDDVPEGVIAQQIARLAEAATEDRAQFLFDARPILATEADALELGQLFDFGEAGVRPVAGFGGAFFPNARSLHDPRMAALHGQEVVYVYHANAPQPGPQPTAEERARRRAENHARAIALDADLSAEERMAQARRDRAREEARKAALNAEERRALEAKGKAAWEEFQASMTPEERDAWAARVRAECAQRDQTRILVLAGTVPAGAALVVRGEPRRIAWLGSRFPVIEKNLASLRARFPEVEGVEIGAVVQYAMWTPSEAEERALA